MKRIHIVGGKNHGKTTLVSDLVVEFNRRGLRVGTIKHTHHQHELDTPGKDSHKHRKAGAAIVGILSRSMNAVFWPNEPQMPERESLPTEERYATFSKMYSDCDLVIVEGDTLTTAPKLEVWRAEQGTDPKAEQLQNVRAIVTDDAYGGNRNSVNRSDISAVADLVMDILELS